MDSTYIHPKLGELYPEDVDWQTDKATVPFSNTPIEVCFANGSKDGPWPAALTGYDWIESHWSEVLGLIQDQAFDFYSPYADAVAGVPVFASPEKLWGTEELLCVRVSTKDDFEVTLRFKWQEKEDPHVITFYVEKGRCETHSVDG
ncbi:MAG: hypothetical protein AMXMBFR7_11730 [Planctomycetota bacterium]